MFQRLIDGTVRNYFFFGSPEKLLPPSPIPKAAKMAYFARILRERFIDIRLCGSGSPIGSILFFELTIRNKFLIITSPDLDVTYVTSMVM